MPSSCWGTCSGFFPELPGNDFEIDIIMCGVCISEWRFGNAMNSADGDRRLQWQHEATTGTCGLQKTPVGDKRRYARAAY